jgi:hypothetical protein
MQRSGDEGINKGASPLDLPLLPALLVDRSQQV